MEMMRTFRWFFRSLNELSVTGVINTGVKSGFGECGIYRQYLVAPRYVCGECQVFMPQGGIIGPGCGAMQT